MKFLKLLPALIFFILAFSYNARSQAVINPPICYGEPIALFCTFFSGGCGQLGATYHWTNASGSWQSNEENPIIFPDSVGYNSDKFYLQVQYPQPPGSFSGGRVTVVVFSRITVTAVTTPIICYGNTNGTITLTVTGGSPAYSYLWNDGATAKNRTGLAAGTYTVTVTDQRGCQNTSYGWSGGIFYNIPGTEFTVGGPSGPLGVTGTPSNMQCASVCDGSISTTVTGGTSPYYYMWNNGATTSGLNNLCAGNYAVTVTDAAGCKAYYNTSITAPPALGLSGTVDDVNCFNGSDGSITLTATGGTGTLTYAWSNGQTTQNATSLATGTYTVTVTDANNCTASQSWFVDQPALLTVSGVESGQKCYGVCDGNIQITPAGGVAPYTFNWSNGETTQNLSTLCPGTYDVTVTDKNGCFAYGSWTITPAVEMTVTGDAFGTSCYAGTNGYININPAGGTGSFTFLWSNGETTQNISGLTAGTYTVTITDGNGCKISDDWTVTQPDLLSVSGVADSAKCNQSATGSITTTTTGGTGAYTYLWNTTETTANINNLLAGTYTVTVTDEKGCEATGSWTVYQPGEISWRGRGYDASCNGYSDGYIEWLSTEGGTPPYSYLWSNGETTPGISNLVVGTYTITVTDKYNCDIFTETTIGQPDPLVADPTGVIVDASCFGYSDGSITIADATGGTKDYTYAWSNGATTQNIAGLAMGYYTVTVTDAHNCFATETYYVGQPDALVFDDVETTKTLCVGSCEGTISVVVTGGTPSYSYAWSNGKTTASIDQLCAGTYTLTVTDDHGCELVGSWEITSPPQLTVTGVPNTALCFQSATGSIITTTTGGTGAYTYLWNTTETTANLYNLLAGTYTVTVTDANSCEATGSWTVNEPGEISWKGRGYDASCNGYSDGYIEWLSTEGGTPEYSYLWSNGATTPGISNLVAGTYTITVTDANSCDIFTETTIGQPEPLVADPTGVIVDASCFGYSDGSITIADATGGTQPYTYAWSNGKTTQNIADLAMGYYTVTVTDAHNCFATETYYVGQPDALVFDDVETTKTLCVGSCEGTISVVVTGGTPSYYYAWSNGKTTASIDQLCAGTYTLTVTDAHSCELVGSWEITSPPQLTVTGVAKDALCNQSATGSITTTTTGGTGAYTYLWNTTETTANLDNLLAGTYTVTVTDENNCTATGSWTVNEPGEISWRGRGYDASCNGYSDGYIEWLSTAGGTPEYSYLWSNGATTPGISNLVAGTYTITVTDANSCDIFTETTIGQPEPLVADPTGVIVDASCFGYSDGSITIADATGGTQPYTYAWSNGKTTQNIADLAMGYYTVTVTDAHNCFATETYYVGQPDALVFDDVETTKTLCVGSCEGTISVVVTGGTPSYYYAWSNGKTTASIDQLCAGTYTLTVTDAHSCELVGSWEITSPPQLTVTGVAKDALCNQSATGSITTTTTGGTGAYTYLWNTTETTANLDNLLAGTYTVTVTDENNCTATGSWTVNEPGEISWRGRGYDASCNGYSDGYIEWLSTEGGTPEYSYLWSNGATTPGISNLVAGTYTITVTDANSCDIFTETTIGQPEPLVADPTGVIVDASCFGYSDGSITIADATGGTQPYTYAWSNGKTTQNIADLAMGYYTVTVTDAHNCFATETYYVGQPDALVFDDVETTKTLCVGSCEGTISVVVTGGTPSYYYAWSNGKTTASIDQLCAGTYTLTVTDAHSCELVGSWEVTSPPQLTVTGVAKDASCNQYSNGSITTTTTGGTGAYTYLWNTTETTANLDNLLAGTYTVTVTDENNCTATGSWTVNEPGEISWRGRGYDASCNGYSDGYIEWLSTAGGTPEYSYLWSNGATTPGISNLVAGTYTITVTDANSCDIFTETTIGQPEPLVADPTGVIVDASCFGYSDGSITIADATGGTQPYTYAWSNGKTTQNIADLAMGYYTVTVTDAHNCFATETYYVGQPDALVFDDVETTKTLCVGSCEGTISVVVTGGTPSYYYAWSNGKTTASIDQLCAGTYTLTVTDAHSCELVGSWEITSPPQLTVTGVAKDASCNQYSNGSITTTTTGGTGAYTYLWNTTETTANLDNLLAGTYTVTVTDENNCTATGSWTVNEPGEISWRGRGYDASCNGYSDGYIEWLSTEGGTPEYSYLWSNGATTPGISNLVAGTYTITVTDANSCDIFTETTIGQPEPLVADPTGVIVDASCFGYSDGSITIADATGGTQPYTYAWSNGKTTQNIADLAMGYYTVTVTDAHNCFATETYYVGQPDALVFDDVETTKTLCVGSCEGTISVVVTGGTPSYYYAWSNGKTTASIDQLCAGTYTLTVTDAHSCELVGSWEITSPPQLTVTGVVDSTSCNQYADGKITTTTTGGTGAYTYLWNTTETTPDLTGLLAGTYTVTVTDANNCTAINSWTVYEPGEVSWKGRGYDVTCNGLSNGYIEWISTAGGTPPYTYLWSNGETTPGISNLVAGTYTITVVDSHGCDVITETVITQPDPLVIDPLAIYDIPTCYQTRCDGSITVNVPTGGTLPYTYLWNNGVTSLFNDNLCAGTYTLTVTDANLCTDVQEFVLEDAPSWGFGIFGPRVACCNTSATLVTSTYRVDNLVGASSPISYEWTVNGGQIISGQNSPEIMVEWDCCETGSVCLTVTQGPDNCYLTKCIDVTVTPTPTPVILGSLSVEAGDTTVYCVENGDPNHLYTWEISGGDVILGQGTPCVTVVWGPYPVCGCGTVEVCEAIRMPDGTAGCQGCSVLNITVLPAPDGINLSGTVSYKNGFGTALDGVVLNLRNMSTNAIVATTVTGPNMNPPLYTGESGYYAFMNVAPGNYRIEASFNGTWGGNNATDALLIQIEAGNPNYLLTNYGELNLKVANVNGSTLPLPNGVSALDALYVKLRTVGSINSYPAGDWKFDNPLVTIPASGAITKDFNGLCYGDVNGTYIPTGLKEANYMSVAEGITETVPVEETFTYAIRSNTNANLGAMTLFMGYNPDLFEVVDIASSNEEMKYVIENGNVAIAWADTRPMNVKSDDNLFLITVKAKTPITEATSVFEVKANSEFADAIGNRYENFELKMSKVITPNGSNEFTLYNYPNPFSANTKIIYTLPETGNVKLVITDMYGRTIRTMVDDLQMAGTYSVNVNAAALNLSAGVYLYRIEVAGATENFVKVNKLIFAK